MRICLTSPRLPRQAEDEKMEEAGEMSSGLHMGSWGYRLLRQLELARASSAEVRGLYSGRDAGYSGTACGWSHLHLRFFRLVGIKCETLATGICRRQRAVQSLRGPSSPSSFTFSLTGRLDLDFHIRYTVHIVAPTDVAYSIPGGYSRVLLAILCTGRT